MTLGQRIYSLRREKKLSQETVAEALNVSRQAVSKWENGQSAPDTENLILLAKLLETDVEYLATGELTEDMESEPLPSPAEEPKPQKSGRDRKRLISVLLILSLCLNGFLLGWLKYERQNEEALAELCAASACSAKEQFADYAHKGSDVYYWQGVADFRCYMQAYHQLTEGESNDYSWLSRLYASMVFEKETVSEYMEQLRKAMRLLSEDIYSPNGFLEISKLNNLIEHGE